MMPYETGTWEPKINAPDAGTAVESFNAKHKNQYETVQLTNSDNTQPSTVQKWITNVAPAFH